MTALVVTALLFPNEVASRLGLKDPNTLAKWRCQKSQSLPWVKIGGRVMYRASDVEKFIESRVVRPAEPLPPKRRRRLRSA